MLSTVIGELLFQEPGIPQRAHCQLQGTLHPVGLLPSCPDGPFNPYNWWLAACVLEGPTPPLPPGHFLGHSSAPADTSGACGHHPGSAGAWTSLTHHLHAHCQSPAASSKLQQGFYRPGRMGPLLSQDRVPHVEVRGRQKTTGWPDVSAKDVSEQLGLVTVSARLQILGGSICLTSFSSDTSMLAFLVSIASCFQSKAKIITTPNSSK